MHRQRSHNCKSEEMHEWTNGLVGGWINKCSNINRGRSLVEMSGATVEADFCRA